MPKKWDTLMNRGSKAIEQRNYLAAINSFSDALAVAETGGNLDERYESFVALGFAYASGKQFQSAADTYSRCLSWCEAANIDKHSQAVCLSSLANVYKELKQYDESQSTALKALIMLDQHGHFEDEYTLVPLMLLAELSVAAGDHGNALLYLSRAITVASKVQSDMSFQFGPKMMELFSKLPPDLVLKCTGGDATAAEGLISKSPWSAALATPSV
jgi:tetratricopeptide (TPR) repeat protein